MTIPPDPFTDGGLPAFARRLRSGNVSAEETVAACLDRIEALEPSLNAFEHLAGESALASARALDRTLAAGIDLGPLMGVPVAVKDLIAVEGMPTTAGSNVDVSDLIGLEVDPDDWQPLRDRLEAAGHTTRDGAHPFMPVDAFYLDDPDGNEVEIATRRPA